MATTRTELEINEESYGVVTTTLVDEDSVAIASADIDAITVTLIAERSGDVINSRSAQDVFNANNCTMHATSGLFTWNVQTADTEIVDNTKIGEIEPHLATFTVTWDTTKKMHFEILLKVKNLRSVT